MKIMGILLFLCIHGLICAAAYFLRKSGIWGKNDNLMPFILFVPVFGICCQLIFEYVSRRKLFLNRADDLEKLEVQDLKYKRIEVDEEGGQDIVPLEEALLMNDTGLRRQMMLDILHKKPAEYVGMLQKAKNSDDTEVIHYATTMMMEVLTEYEKKLQKLERAYVQEPDSKPVLKEYIQVLQEFLKTGLVSGALYKIYQEKALALYAQYRERFGRKRTIMFAEIETLLELGDTSLARERLKEADEKYAKDARLYRLYGQLYYDTKEYGKFRQMIESMKENHVYLDKESREWLRFWEENEEKQLLG